jgi:arylsulfatase A-like enzyme
MTRRLLFAPLVGLVVLGFVAMEEPAQAAPAKPNVLVILADAMRADVLGPYGYKLRNTTPNMDKIAAAGVVWDRTFSQDAWTVPCVASLFTGVDPQAHKTMRYQVKERVEMDTLSLGHTTMAEEFKAAGYNTAAFIKSTVIDSSRGFSQGFDSFQVVPGADQASGRSGEQLNEAAIPWINAQKGADRPFFAYVHFMDPHSPYKAPEPWYSKYKDGYTGPLTGAHLEIEALTKSGKPPTPADVTYIHALYDAEIEYYDTQLGRLVGALDAAGLGSNTIVVITGDHGEAIWEHGQTFHGNLWQENIHIPMIVRGPGIKAGHLPGNTQQIDLAPTLSDLAGVPKSPLWMGTSHADAMRTGKPGPGETAYSEYIDMRTIVDPAGMKLMLGDGATKLFDLNKDPLEKTNLAPTHPGDVMRLSALMDQRTAAGRTLSEKFPTEQARELSPEEVQMLKDLGYVE